MHMGEMCCSCILLSLCFDNYFDFGTILQCMRLYNIVFLSLTLFYSNDGYAYL